MSSGRGWAPVRRADGGRGVPGSSGARQLDMAARQLGQAARMVALVGTALLLTASSTVVGSQASPRADAGPGAPGAAGIVGSGRGDAGTARVTITPRDGAAGVRPDLGAVVRVADSAPGTRFPVRC